MHPLSILVSEIFLLPFESVAAIVAQPRGQTLRYSENPSLEAHKESPSRLNHF
jgi:hypothetical protein